jgi:signal transduction histidine kinase
MTRILIIDDEKDFVALMGGVLKKKGYEVDGAFSGEAGLEVLARDRPDIVILDIMMPDMDGFEVLKRIREDKDNDKMAVIISSVLEDERTIVKGLELGADDYIVKGYDSSILLAKMGSISRALEMDKKLEEYSRGLERKVKERTEELRRYARELEKSNEMKGFFSDILCHDLINYANVIMTSAHVLKDDIAREEFEERVEIISEYSDRMMELLHNAAMYTKLESFSGLEFKRGELRHYLDRALNQLASLLEKNHTTVEVYDDEGGLSRLNPLIEQVFSNFLSNAVKYGPNGGKIDVSIKKDDGSWRVEVSDRGEGVPDSQKERIFKRFERLDKKGIKGTGLGLTIAKKIVEIHGGRVGVKDRKGGGSTFWFTVPGPSNEDRDKVEETFAQAGGRCDVP